MARKSKPNDQHQERIAKVIARAGLCSRREAEAWIAAGRVAVNDAVIASPALNVGPRDRISVDGASLPQRERTRLFLYHKPRGLVTTTSDPEGRPTIFSRLPANLPRLISVGRLDMNTEGLLLLTNDGGLARVLELPETGWLRRYRVRAHGRVRKDDLDRLKDGVTIDGVRYGAIEAGLDREQGSNVWLTFAIREGKNREVRKVLEHLGLKVNRLIRVSYGPFQLGELPDGAVEEVKTRVLADQLGKKLAEQAAVDFSAPIIVREPAEAEQRPERRSQEKAGKGRPMRPPPRAKPQPETDRRRHGPGLKRSVSKERGRDAPRETGRDIGPDRTKKLKLPKMGRDKGPRTPSAARKRPPKSRRVADRRSGPRPSRPKAK